MKRALLLAATLAALSGCSTLKVRAEFAEKTDFTRYRSWAWRPLVAGAGEVPRVRDPAIQAVIKSTVERELAARGLKQVELDARPDLLVDTFGWSQDRTETRQSAIGLRGSGYTYDPGASSSPVTEVRTLRDGTLMVDLFDAATRARVWRGTATESLAPGAAPGAVEQAIAGLLAQFPPRKR
jgi:hypothetical protein